MAEGADLVDAITLIGGVAVFSAASLRYLDVLGGVTDERELELSTAIGFFLGVVFGIVLAVTVY